ncbi:uncharacterized protein AB675_1117 [Cyphellophora attinorum]|uniref:Large ribosomal subunit protein uL15/eL18 domain-containing protein n=1 Tax=Cyphellophora attinorum TaxID=1664694 RepID=A0A0N1NX97_9EURO|nr:uncharacterized protein AB675_1117 [Phialophora attinorum]KPI38140.1 hypothetical protein AB675_1117 [Phialophora attinorum]
MPPRLPLRSLATVVTPPLTSLPTSTATSIPTFLLPFLTRSASILSNLRNVPPPTTPASASAAALPHEKAASLAADTKARSKKAAGTSLASRAAKPPTMSFTGTMALQITSTKELCVSKVVGKVKDGVKLLAKNGTDLTTPIHVVVSRASKSAIAAVEALGGSVTTRFYTHAAIRRIRKGDMHPYVSLQWDQSAIGNAALMVEGAQEKEEVVKGLGYEFRLPDPTSRKDLEYYRDRENRGYLSHRVKEGHSPSLFYATEAQIEDGRRAKEEARKAGVIKKNKTNAEENKLW